MLETIALGSLAVVGAQQGIVRGLHPLVSSSLGVTVAFGGVLRDLMCGQEPRLASSTGCQSYAVASLSGAAVYVALRQAHVWNCAGSCTRLVQGGLPIGLRIALAAGTVCAVRAYAWEHRADGEAPLFASMDAAAEANEAALRRLAGGGAA